MFSICIKFAKPCFPAKRLIFLTSSIRRPLSLALFMCGQLLVLKSRGFDKWTRANRKVEWIHSPHPILHVAISRYLLQSLMCDLEQRHRHYQLWSHWLTVDHFQDLNHHKQSNHLNLIIYWRFYADPDPHHLKKEACEPPKILQLYTMLGQNLLNTLWLASVWNQIQIQALIQIRWA